MLTRNSSKRRITQAATEAAPTFGLEGLEDRRMLSVTPAFHTASRGAHASDATSTTTFADLQTSDVAAYNELNTLAGDDGLTIAGTDTVFVRSPNSTTTDYSVVLPQTSGPNITLTSDEDGNVVLPTSGTTTFGVLQAANSTAAAELTTLATAEGLTISATQTVNIRGSRSTTDYAVVLTPSSGPKITLTSDADGNVVLPTSGTTTFAVLQAANSAAATELTSLATADSLTISSTQTVTIRDNRGTTDYSVVFTPSVGTRITLTTDASGNPVYTPTHSTTTFGDLETSDAAAATELSILATDEGLTAPASTQNVEVTTTGPATTYTITLGGGWRGASLTVDAAGDPSGNERVPFEALSSAIQSGLNTLAAPYSTSFSSTSTQSVDVQTVGAATTYTIRINGTGQSIEITVDSSGNPATAPTSGSGFGGGMGGLFGAGGFGLGGLGLGFGGGMM